MVKIPLVKRVLRGERKLSLEIPLLLPSILIYVSLTFNEISSNFVQSEIEVVKLKINRIISDQVKPRPQEEEEEEEEEENQ